MARIVFQPIEEISRVFFSRVLSETTTPVPANGPNRESLQQASSALVSLLAIQSSFTVVVAGFGYAYMPIAILTLLPPKYMSTSAPKVLSAWIWYIPFLAVNGALEAFVSSVANSRDLSKQSRCVNYPPFSLSNGAHFQFEVDDHLFDNLHLFRSRVILAPDRRHSSCVRERR